MWDLSGLPEALNDALFGGTNLLAAQLFLVSVPLIAVLLPMMYAKLRWEVLVAIEAFIIMMAAGVGWLPDYVVMVFLLICAAMLAKLLTGWVKGTPQQ